VLALGLAERAGSPAVGVSPRWAPEPAR
jgi:hypothetical protein